MVCIDKADPGRTVWRMTADERFANPAGTIQGGFVSAFVDSAMGAATVTWARSRDAKVFSVNAEMKVSFLKAATVGSVLTCTAEVVSGGARALFAEAVVVDDADRMIARASSTYLLTPRQ
jgi:uncharacterized protein (TIGR00369 family)